MGVKKIHSIFMRYMLIVAGGILLLVAVNWGLYALGTNTGFIVPATEVEHHVTTVKEKIQAGDLFSENDIPPFCDYALFSSDGSFLQGTLTQENAVSLWKASMIDGKNSLAPYRIAVISRENEVILLQYRFTSQFSNNILRRICPAADLLLVGLLIVEIIMLLFLVSRWFGKYTGKKIANLLSVTKKIEEQDLDFKIESSGIFEIDRALDALEHLKQALRNSLAEQWRAEKMRQAQISALAHDLKTPLTIVRGNTELLYDTTLSDEQKECADYIESSSIQMQNYVQTLIEVSKSKESFPFHSQSVEISSFLQELSMQAKGLCVVKGIQLKWENLVSVEHIIVDKEQLIRALINIVSNAVEYTPVGGYISLNVSSDGSYVQFIITDTGNGFSAEALTRATEQFYMSDHSRSSKSHYGMGLYITDSIINQHGGQLILENSTETGGARVTVKIPC